MALVLATTEAERRPVTSVYIEILQGNLRKEDILMTDYELLSIMLTILAIITSILVAYINQKK